MSTDLVILDVGCGDGVGLKVLRESGFHNLYGVDLHQDKAEKAQQYADVTCADFHRLDMFDTNSVDFVVCSHALEHAYHPSVVAMEMRRVLRSTGRAFVVVPFPDTGDAGIHTGKHEMGTIEDDGGMAVTAFFHRCGFDVVEKQFDSFREPEIWLFLLPKRV